MCCIHKITGNVLFAAAGTHCYFMFHWHDIYTFGTFGVHHAAFGECCAGQAAKATGQARPGACMGYSMMLRVQGDIHVNSRT